MDDNLVSEYDYNAPTDNEWEWYYFGTVNGWPVDDEPEFDFGYDDDKALDFYESREG